MCFTLAHVRKAVTDNKLDQCVDHRPKQDGCAYLLVANRDLVSLRVIIPRQSLRRAPVLIEPVKNSQIRR